MNSKFLVLLMFFALVGCGMKGDPKAPKDSYLPSLIEKNYPDIELAAPINEND